MRPQDLFLMGADAPRGVAYMSLVAPGSDGDWMVRGTVTQGGAAPELTFTMKGLHGELLLRSSGPGMVLKAVMAGGRDVTDTPHEFNAEMQAEAWAWLKKWV